jgi:hypothetical protein
MKLGNLVSRVVIDTRTLNEYALNPENPVGANKAQYLQYGIELDISYMVARMYLTSLTKNHARRHHCHYQGC